MTHGGIEIFRQEVDSTKNYSGDGYIKWTNTWVHNEYQRSAALHPKTNFKEISLEVAITLSAKLGMVFIFILPLVPDRDMPAIALFFESNIAAPIP